MTSNSATHRGRKLGAAVVALALGAFGLIGLSSTASADPIYDVGDIDSSQNGQGSIIVTKYEKSPGNGIVRADGTQQTVAGTVLPGVTFSIQEVVYDDGLNTPLNLETNAGWTDASAVATYFAANSQTLPTGYTTISAGGNDVTDGSGIASWTGLGFGLYLITEVSSPSNVVDPAAPFLVSVPFPTGPAAADQPNAWLYDVYVYPKNSVTDTTKSVNSSDASFNTQADYVSWTIVVNIPDIGGQSFTDFSVTDKINQVIGTAQLEFWDTGDPLPAGISPRSVTVKNSSGVTQTFTDGTDYNITFPDSDTQVVTFTDPDGLENLRDNAPGGTVTFVVPTKILSVGNGVLHNDAKGIVNQNDNDADADTDLGQLRVFKYALVNKDDNDATPMTKEPLQGATFQIFLDADGDGVVDAGELDTPVTSGGGTSFSSDVNGFVDIPVLKVGKYFLVETVAPVGYQLDPTPRPVTIVAGPWDDDPAVNYIEISNDQVPPWLLPFTGGSGVLIFSLLGGGLMALAFGLAFVAFRRRKAAQAA
ncbi:MAG: SpaH/EbpB family LPXTG-anchored major pilin [Cryobacterium sp.]|nr:SpaH/EbpB family LPXTG-anchored major pilin [Cryobacterium sp.]